MELVVARNPDAARTLPYLVRVPLGDGLVFRTKGTWPRTSALYCHPVPLAEWPQEPEVVERIALRACARRGAAIDVVADRAREQRSQLVFTKARGRDVVFWQAPRTARQSRPDVRVPAARAAGAASLEIVVDTRERYPYRFAGQAAQVQRRALACGRYAVCRDGLAELQVRFPTVALVPCETRKLAEGWTYRYLAAAHLWAQEERAGAARVSGEAVALAGPAVPDPTSRELRAWARERGLEVADRGRLRPEVLAAWRAAHGAPG